MTFFKFNIRSRSTFMGEAAAFDHVVKKTEDGNTPTPSAPRRRTMVAHCQRGKAKEEEDQSTEQYMEVHRSALQ